MLWPGFRDCPSRVRLGTVQCILTCDGKANQCGMVLLSVAESASGTFFAVPQLATGTNCLQHGLCLETLPPSLIVF